MPTFTMFYLYQKIMQKKSEIFKKHFFLGQALDFLPPRKPGLYISRVDFFFFEYQELLAIKDKSELEEDPDAD